MAWNEPPNGNDDKDKKDPWGNRNRNGQDGPPDIDEVFKQLNGQFKKLFGGGGSNNRNNQPGNSAGFWAILGIAAVVVVGYFSFYTVDEQEKAVVLRMGKYQPPLQEPGLRWRIPLIDEVIKVNVTRLAEMSMSEKMLTGDENIVDITLSVQYRSEDAEKYALRVQDPEKSLKSAAEAALRHVVGEMTMSRVITEGRSQLGIEVKARLQRHMDEYETGIIISTVNVENASPPTQVKAAYDDVIKAREDEVRLQEQARAYANSVVPKAEGLATRVLQEAQAYKEEIIAKAEGEAQRFTALMNEYQKAPEVTRQRLYLETVSKVFAQNQKVIVDVEGGNNMMYLPLDRLGVRNPAQGGN